MGEIMFRMSQIGNAPEIAEMNLWYKNEMARRGMASNWPNTELYHFAAIYYNGQPISMVIFAPIEAHRKVYITGAYTLPSWRRLGIYQTLMREMINLWRGEGLYDELRSGYNKKNETSRIIQEKRGAIVDEEREHAVRTVLSLKPTGEEWELTSERFQTLCDKLDKLSG
jgi:GNAT superfamily N-acetyltransferase